jgi:hypothetical protein
LRFGNVLEQGAGESAVTTGLLNCRSKGLGRTKIGVDWVLSNPLRSSLSEGKESAVSDRLGIMMSGRRGFRALRKGRLLYHSSTDKRLRRDDHVVAGFRASNESGRLDKRCVKKA